jgi:hypothetical protein
MATPKILGSAPEPYDGKPEKADAFINNLGNYYFLNTGTYNTDQKKVSSALTYFKIGTPAGEWACDRQSAALTATPPNFGTWANFQTLFKAHFVPAHTELEATQYLHINKMGSCPFNEWYQEWSTQAERSNSNAHTKMFCFRKAIPPALHQKILGVTLAPDTMEELVRLAREFDRNYRLYTTPSDNFRGNRGPRNRAMVAEDSDRNVVSSNQVEDAAKAIGPAFLVKMHIMICHGLHNSWVSRQGESPISHGQPAPANIGDSSMFHGPADVGWVGPGALTSAELDQVLRNVNEPKWHKDTGKHSNMHHGWHTEWSEHRRGMLCALVDSGDMLWLDYEVGGVWSIVEKCMWMHQRVEIHYGWSRREQEIREQWRSEAVCTRQWICIMVGTGGRSTREKKSSLNRTVRDVLQSDKEGIGG